MSDNIRIAFNRLFEGDMNAEEMREFLLGLQLNEETSVESIAVAAEVMRSHAITLPISEKLREKSMDIVGTGGDKIGSFNISSTVAILVAACGGYVAKHGSRSITSKSGSADLLEVLGINLNMSLHKSAKLLEEVGFTFMFAANHHPAMKFIVPVRKTIPDKTIFNILGPLTNPAGVKKSMLGVFDKVFLPKIAQALQQNGSKSHLVVSSKEGMDEISISDITYAAELKEGVNHEFIIDPQEYGIQKAPLSAIIGGDAKQNAQILYNIFDNNATEAQRDIVLLNAGASLMVSGLVSDIPDGIEMAKEALLKGHAKEKLRQIVEISNKL